MNPQAALGAVVFVGGVILGVWGFFVYIVEDGSTSDGVSVVALVMVLGGFAALLWGLYHLLVGL